MSRGMIKWQPFQSLKEQAVYLHKMQIERRKIEKPELSEDQIEEINYHLTHYNKEDISVLYYKNGFLYEEKGVIRKIDPTFQYLIINDKKIEFNNLIELNLL